MHETGGKALVFCFVVAPWAPSIACKGWKLRPQFPSLCRTHIARPCTWDSFEREIALIVCFGSGPRRSVTSGSHGEALQELKLPNP